MKTFFCVTALSFTFASQAACAQSTVATPPVLEETDAAGSKVQKVEHIRHSDAGNTIEEVRVGGETKSITVQPANKMPSYEIMPEQRSTPGNAGSGGQRVWKVIRF